MSARKRYSIWCIPPVSWHKISCNVDKKITTSKIVEWPRSLWTCVSKKKRSFIIYFIIDLQAKILKKVVPRCLLSIDSTERFMQQDENARWLRSHHYSSVQKIQQQQSPQPKPQLHRPYALFWLLSPKCAQKGSHPELIKQDGLHQASQSQPWSGPLPPSKHLVEEMTVI